MMRDLIISTNWRKTLPLQSYSSKVVIQRNGMIPQRNAHMPTLLTEWEH